MLHWSKPLNYFHHTKTIGQIAFGQMHWNNWYGFDCKQWWQQNDIYRNQMVEKYQLDFEMPLKINGRESFKYLYECRNYFPK